MRRMRNLVMVLVLAGCTEKNPNVCSIDTDCGDGLVCRGNSCIAESCSTSSECEASAPYCLASMLCAAKCDADNECPGFNQDANAKFCSSGTCVACRTDDDCASTSPVCAQGSCRACQLDSECESGACGTNGACIAEDAIVYASPTGTDVGTCGKASPCATLKFAVQNTLANRSHIVLAAGTYPETTALISSLRTAAPAITVHGGGATLKSITSGDNAMIEVEDVAMTLDDVRIEAATASFGATLFTGTAPVTFRNVAVEGHGSLDGIYVGANVTLDNVELSNVHAGIVLRDQAHLLASRVSIHGGLDGMRAGLGTGIISMSNVVVYDLTRSTLDLPNITGSIEYSTIADTIDRKSVV